MQLVRRQPKSSSDEGVRIRHRGMCLWGRDSVFHVCESRPAHNPRGQALLEGVGGACLTKRP